MSKKTYKILLLCCAVVFIIGLILAINNKTPYQMCCDWLSEGSSSFYNYAVRNIARFTALYFGGITLMVGGVALGGTLTIGRYLKKNELTPNEVVKNAID